MIRQLPLYMSNLELHSVLVEKAQSPCRDLTCDMQMVSSPIRPSISLNFVWPDKEWDGLSLSLSDSVFMHTHSSIYPDSQGMVGGTVSQLSLWSCRSTSETMMSLCLYFPSLSTLLFSFLSRNNLMHYMLMKKHSLRGAIPFSGGQLSKVGITSCRPR